MADINAAKTLAGANGKLFFPSGVYDIDGLTADEADQTWVMQKGVTLLRNTASAAHGVSIPSGNSLHMIGGTLDMNRTNNSNDAYRGINSVDGDFKWSGDWHLKACPGPGLSVHNGLLELEDGLITDTRYMGIYWVALSNGSDGKPRQAPKLHRVKVDRREGYGSSGGIILNGGGSAVTSHAAIVHDCEVQLPRVTTDAARANYYDAVAIEINRCYRPSVIGNISGGGRISISFASCASPVDVGNRTYESCDYGHEHVASEWAAISGNNSTGMFLPGESHGIILSGACVGCSVTGNSTKIGFASPVTNISTPSAYPHQFAGNVV